MTSHSERKMELYPFKLAKIITRQLELYGYSRAGEETVVVAPDLDLVFDIGRCPREAVAMGHILLTHGHPDHAAGLPYYFCQRYFTTQKVGIALVPSELVAPLDELLHAFRKIVGGVLHYRLVGMGDQGEYELNAKFKVYTFATHHTVPSLGFAVVEVRHKLKPEFLACTPTELVALKERQIPLTYLEEVPLIAYLGDTMADSSYAKLPYVKKAKILITECTFFTEEQRVKSQQYRHLHLNDLAQFLATLENERIILTHTTKSLQLHRIEQFLKKALSPELLARVTLLWGGCCVQSIFS